MSYKVKFTDFTRSKNMAADLAELQDTFGFAYLKKIADQIDATKNDRFNPRKYFAASTMRVERYYSSIMEENSPLTADAHELLDKQDYVGFFMACGSNYVRSIRRAQEVTAVFTFESPNVDLAQSFALGLKSSGFGSTLSTQVSTKSKFRPITESLEVKILAFGLGLNVVGTGSLIANSIEEYNDVMKFAFEAMTKTPHGYERQQGMVYGIELVPWVDNVSFQVAAAIQSEAIEVPLPRSVIAKAIVRNSAKDPLPSWVNDDATRTEFKCKESSYKMDKYGYCCEENALYKTESQEYDRSEPKESICRPLRLLDKSIVRNTMAVNGEFVTRLDAAIRSRVNQLSTLEQCVTTLRSYPDNLDNNIVRAQDTAKYDANIATSFTVKELKLALDPFQDFGLVSHMTHELDEYMDMFYQPCIKALFGGRDVDSELTNFMVKPWHVHKECMQLSCLTDSMRWNRGEKGGCKNSLITGTMSKGYADENDSGCTYDSELGQDEEICKYTQENLSTFHARATSCWKYALQFKGRIDYLMDNFCVPTITDDVVSKDKSMALDLRIQDYCPMLE